MVQTGDILARWYGGAVVIYRILENADDCIALYTDTFTETKHTYKTKNILDCDEYTRVYNHGSIQACDFDIEAETRRYYVDVKGEPVLCEGDKQCWACKTVNTKARCGKEFWEN